MGSYTVLKPGLPLKKHQFFPFYIFKNIFIQFSKGTFYLQLLQNIEYIPHVVTSLSLSNIQQFVSSTPHPNPAITGNH